MAGGYCGYRDQEDLLQLLVTKQINQQLKKALLGAEQFGAVTMAGGYCGYRDQEDLDQHMAPSCWVKRLPQDQVVADHIAVSVEGTRRARQSLKCELDVVYGPGRQKIDFYYPHECQAADKESVFVYIHGGYWQALSKDQSGNLVLPLCKAGFTVALIGYDLAPQVTLTQIVDECCKGVALIALRHPHAQLVIGGHSCGAHLAASLMYTKWGEYGLRECPLKGVVMLDGIFDLQPFQLCQENRAVQVTDAEVAQYSPLLLSGDLLTVTPGLSCLLVLGEHSSPEFIKQNQLYQKVLLKHGMVAHLLTLAGDDHFSMINRLSEEGYFLTKTLIAFIKTVVGEV